MNKLKVEELESRHLLNNTSFFPEPPHSQPFAAVTYAFIVVERSPFVDYGSHAALFGWGWPGEGEGEIGHFRSFAEPGFDGRGPGAPGPHVVDHQGPGLARPETWGSTALWSGGDKPGPGSDAAGGLGAARVTTGAASPASPVPANNIREATGAAAALLALPLAQPTPQPRPLLENLAGARSLPVQIQGLVADRSPVWAVRRDGGSSGSAGNLGEESWKLHNRPGMSATTQAGEGSVLPSPKVSEVLAVLPPFNLSALEVGMQQFLQQLEKLGPRLAMDEDGTMLWPWIVAVTAAATACEIARRELRRPPSVLAVAGMSGCPNDHLFGGSS